MDCLCVCVCQTAHSRAIAVLARGYAEHPGERLSIQLTAFLFLPAWFSRASAIRGWMIACKGDVHLEHDARAGCTGRQTSGKIARHRRTRGNGVPRA